ncbi:hypothetical protein TNCV_1407301 [Trichonephila clavipes]|nr:hypothetical protein TNCV_1407301 [Trichonephila clavipes]
MANMVARSHTVGFFFPWNILKKSVYGDDVSTQTNFVARVHAVRTLPSSLAVFYPLGFFRGSLKPLVYDTPVVKVEDLTSRIFTSTPNSLNASDNLSTVGVGCAVNKFERYSCGNHL